MHFYLPHRLNRVHNAFFAPRAAVCHIRTCLHEPSYPFCIVRWRRQHANGVYILHLQIHVVGWARPYILGSPFA
jgi:hypothetical protein